MKESPILFSGPMVRAILEGRKTQTRRVVSERSRVGYPHCEIVAFHASMTEFKTVGGLRFETRCPYGQPGDRDWRREPIPADGWYYVRGLLAESAGGDARPVYVRVHDGDLLWGFSERDDPEAMSLDGGPTQEAVEWKRPGDRLWVRETFRYAEDLGEDWERGHTDVNPFLIYDADGHEQYWETDWPNYQPPLNAAEVHNSEGQPDHWRSYGPIPSIFMPRWASRIDLEITGVRLERLQDISEEDAKAEGAIAEPCDHARRTCDEIGCYGSTAKAAFRELWESINGPDSWQANPWVWVVEFKRVMS